MLHETLKKKVRCSEFLAKCALLVISYSKREKQERFPGSRSSITFQALRKMNNSAQCSNSAQEAQTQKYSKITRLHGPSLVLKSGGDKFCVIGYIVHALDRSRLCHLNTTGTIECRR